jgi:hypothetical protein
MNRILVLASALLASACTYDEGLIIENMKGTVRLPAAVGTRTVVDANGQQVELVDPRFIGPVYLGLYSGVAPVNTVQDYPHPEVGPQYDAPNPAQAYPYGGTSIGDFRYPCLEALVCRVVSDRFTNFDDLVSFFNETIDTPLVDAAGQPVNSGEYLQQTCFDQLEVSTDREVRITAEDRNDDGQINEMDLDFQLDDSGEFFVGDFELLQQEFFWDQDQEDCTPGQDCKGFTLWGFVDSPNAAFSYSTCDTSVNANAFDVNEYSADFQGGAAFRDILNTPSKRITEGDWVASEGYQWDNVYEQPELVIDFEVQ